MTVAKTWEQLGFHRPTVMPGLSELGVSPRQQAAYEFRFTYPSVIDHAKSVGLLDAKKEYYATLDGVVEGTRYWLKKVGRIDWVVGA